MQEFGAKLGHKSKKSGIYCPISADLWPKWARNEENTAQNYGPPIERKISKFRRNYAIYCIILQKLRDLEGKTVKLQWKRIVNLFSGPKLEIFRFSRFRPISFIFPSI